MFGRPIGQNQGVQFPIARAYIGMRAAGLMVREAASLYEAGKECGAEANMAKHLAAETSWAAADMCVQTHGGFGFAEEFDIRAQIPRNAALYGSADFHQSHSVVHRRARLGAAAILLEGVADYSPLSGLLIVSLEQAVAAPMCGCKLADAGARVIKIERPEGDFARTYDTLAHGECSYFVWLNRGKESVVLDLTTAADRALLAAMLKRADVFVQNLKPGAIEKLGFPIAELRREFPRLVCCSISGFGETGPHAARKAYDLLIQAESGLAAITGTSEPARVGVSVVDITTGLNAYQSILEALIGRARTGEGAELSVSMFDSMADWMAVPLLQFEGGKPPQRMGLATPRSRLTARSRAATASTFSFASRTIANGVCWARRCSTIPRLPPTQPSPPTSNA